MEAAEISMSLDEATTSAQVVSTEMNKSKRRTLVERELVTTLTSKITSPVLNGEPDIQTSRYGRARKTKSDSAFYDTDKALKIINLPELDKTLAKTPNKPRTSKSPVKRDKNINGSYEGINNLTESLSKHGTVLKPSPNKKTKLHVRKDLIPKKNNEETVNIIKNMFSPTKDNKPSANTHLNNILERSSEKYAVPTHLKQKTTPAKMNVVKTLDFDSNKKKKDVSLECDRKRKPDECMSKSELFQIEAKCEYQVGDLAWSRVGTYPFWPCIVTREPHSDLCVKIKMQGRVERHLIHVTFFGDNGRRGWIPNNMLRKFKGQLEFESARSKFTPEDKKRDPRLYAAFYISASKMDVWLRAVEEAESLLREPKRLRMDLLHAMLANCPVKQKSNKSGKITRTDSDVSLSESLYDTLFSEDDSFTRTSEESRRKSRNRSLDVSDIVTACIDNMATKTGMAKIQKQSHMDRWLQKAKSKTPEKPQMKLQTTPNKTNDKKVTLSLRKSKNKNTPIKDSKNKKYSLRKSDNETYPLEHDYTKFDIENENPIGTVNSQDSFAIQTEDSYDHVCEIGFMAKIETLNEKIKPSTSEDTEAIETSVVDEVLVTNEPDLDKDNVNNAEISKDLLNQSATAMKVDESLSTNLENKSQIEESMISDNDDRNSTETQVDLVLEEMVISNNIEETLDTTENKRKNPDTEDLQHNEDLENFKKEKGANTTDSNTDVNKVKVTPEIINEDIDFLQNDAPESPTFTQAFEDVPQPEKAPDYYPESPTFTQDYDCITKKPINRDPSEENQTLIIPNDKVQVSQKAESANDKQDKTEFAKEHDKPMVNGVVQKEDLNVQKDKAEEATQDKVTKAITKETETDDLVQTGIDLHGDDQKKIRLSIEEISKHTKPCYVAVNNDNFSIYINNTDITGSHFVKNLNIDDDRTTLSSEVVETSQSEEHSSDSDYVNRTAITFEQNLVNDKPNTRNREKSTKIVNDDSSDETADIVLSDNNSLSSGNVKINGDLIESISVSIQSEIESVACIESVPGEKPVTPENETANALEKEIEENTKLKRKPRAKNETKQSTATNDMYKALDDPEFVKYLELRQDALIDENPHISQDDVVKYLHKTWVYEQSMKSDIIKSDDLEQSNLVKGLGNESAVQPKKVRQKKSKVDKDSVDDEYLPVKDKPKRKSSKQYYNEDDTDIEEEIALFEIFKNNKKDKPRIKPIDAQSTSTTVEESSLKSEFELDEINGENNMTESEILDDIELFFADLTRPKPNLFKGLIREKICELCLKPGSVVKCKGPCCGWFHFDCAKKQTEKTDEEEDDKKKKKVEKRGRKPKIPKDGERDLNTADDFITIENPILIDDVEDFEAKFTAKMQEMLQQDYIIEVDPSSDNGLDWKNTVAGKCEIVDVKLKIKPQTPEALENFKCNNCLKHDKPLCFVCKSDKSPKNSTLLRQKCQLLHCHRYYHIECLDQWPQTQYNAKNNLEQDALTCPRHVCHTCVSDDPRGCKTRFSGDKLARCVKCPATYHSFTKCIPAGTEIINASYVICPRHYENKPGTAPRHVNTGWCFICALGGSLICCEHCPTSFHADCLNIKPPEGGYICEDCETGRLPLYGEMVWVKLGHYRWWPGIILHPSEIPANLLSVRHTLGEFVVRFFGQYDHYWVNRGRVFPFQEGDSGKISSQKSKLDEAFQLAVEHAHRAFDIVKASKQQQTQDDIEIQSSLLPPHYIKLRVNKPLPSLPQRKLAAATQCDCDPNEEAVCPPGHCLNRMLLTECGPWCRGGNRCLNRAFERREYPKLRPLRTPSRGWGLYTLEDIQPGQFVIEYVGELIDMDEFHRRMNRMHAVRDENFYFLTLDKDRMIDAGPKGNLARFMNHSCDPNCETQKWTVLGDVRVGLFAIKFIPANTEVTFNYNLECAGIDKKPCMCGAKRCSGYIGAKPKSLEEVEPKRVKRVYKKRKQQESPTLTKPKVPKPRTTMRSRPKELTDIEKDLLIIKNATNGISSDSESSRLSSLDREPVKPMKRKRVSFSNEEKLILNNDGGNEAKKMKIEENGAR